MSDIRSGFMDKVDFEEELGNALGGNRVYPSVEDLKKQQPCVSDCGIVKVEVRVTKVIRKTDFSDSIAKAKEHARTCKSPLPTWVMPGDLWLYAPGFVPQGPLKEIARIRGEQVYWKGGGSVNGRELTGPDWTRVGNMKFKRKWWRRKNNAR